MARTLPKSALLRSAHLLKPEQVLDLAAFTEALTAAGYARCQQVEGVGQFAVRGGILDVFSPLMEKPVRCELFGDEIDSMGLFDPGTQRRVQNVTEALILPCAEVLPHLAEGGLPGLADAMEAQAKRLRRRQGTEKIEETVLADAQQLRGGVLPGGLDRYLSLIHPQFTTALDYLDPASLVFLCEGGRIDQRAKSTLLQLRQEADTLMEAGCMAGEGADLLLSENALYAALSDFPAVMMDALPTSRLPLKPRSLLHIDARQLSSYGGSLETAAADMEHYRKSGSGVLVLCGGETRAKNLLRILEERGIPAVLDLPGRAMPAPGEVRLTLGALSAGSEWPSLNLAILTEGQLLSVQRKRPARAPKESNRQKLQSYTDLKPGDLVVHVHHGIGRFAGIHRLPTDGVEKDYIKLDYAGGDCLYVPVTQLDMVSKYIGGGEDAQEKTRLNKLGGTEWTKQRSRANAIINLMGAVGGMLYLGVAAVLYPTDKVKNLVHVNYQPLFLVVSAIMAAAVAVLLLTIREPRLSAENQALEARHPEWNLAEDDGSGHEVLPKPVKRSLGFLLASIALWYIGYNGVTTWFTTYISEIMGEGLGTASRCLLVATAGAIVSYIPIGAVASKVGRRKTILAGCALLAACFFTGFLLTTAFSTLNFAMYIVFALVGLAWAAINVNSLPMVVEMCKGSDIGKFTGYYYTASMAAQVVTPVLAGTLMRHVSYKILFPYATLFVALSFVTMCFVRHGDSKAEAKRGLDAFEEMD